LVSNIKVLLLSARGLTLASKNGWILPLFHLPYATYRASHYDIIDDVYTFSNIRYAAPPTGVNRFRAPQRPKKQIGIQDGSEGHACYQSNPSQFLIAKPISNGITQSEDCLFLDISVPGWIVRGQNEKDTRIAVVHWIFGGGFGLGQFVYVC
jgi:carboxylesterase type B